MESNEEKIKFHKNMMIYYGIGCFLILMAAIFSFINKKVFFIFGSIAVIYFFILLAMDPTDYTQKLKR